MNKWKGKYIRATRQADSVYGCIKKGWIAKVTRDSLYGFNAYSIGRMYKEGLGWSTRRDGFGDLCYDYFEVLTDEQVAQLPTDADINAANVFLAYAFTFDTSVLVGKRAGTYARRGEPIIGTIISVDDHPYEPGTKVCKVIYEKEGEKLLGREDFFLLDGADTLKIPAVPTDAVLEHTRTVIDHCFPDMYRDQQQRVINTKRRVAEAKKTLEEYQERQKGEEEVLAKTPKRVEYSVVELQKEIEQVKRLHFVEKAEISPLGNIVIHTKMLRRVENGKQTRKRIGRLVLIYDYADHMEIRGTNKDYAAKGYPHPHMVQDGSHICFGDNLYETQELMNKGKIYQLTDYVITMLSQIPQPESRPYMGYYDWIKARKRIAPPTVFREVQL